MAAFFWALAMVVATPSPAPAASSPISLMLETVPPGREGLEFSAYLAGTTHPITRGLRWTIRTAGGENIYAAETGTADVVTLPGDYIVDVQYGAGRLTRLVSLPEATRLRIHFALNAGGLRIVPRAGGAPLPMGGATLRVYTLQQGQPNRHMALNATAGEILPLPEGHYRIESQVGDGNARAVADVEVKAGRLSTLDIRHKAGVARLSFAAPAATEVAWTVADGRGATVATRVGQDTAVILVPGDYTVTAITGGRRLRAAFTIATGQTRNVILGN